MTENRPVADVCLILEGTYPYVTGGVSSWTHDLIRAQADLTFHLLTILPPDADRKIRYELPANVVGRQDVTLQELQRGGNPRNLESLLRAIEEPLLRLQAGGNLGDLQMVFERIGPHARELGSDALLNSKPAWDLLLRMYGRTHARSSFLDYFWSWRALIGGLFSMLLADLPPARVYHTVCTGYAGLLAARAKLERRRPVVLTEHGIYTNERRVEIGLAEWLHDKPISGFSIVRDGRLTLKELWINSFLGYSRACYQASDRIVTLYEGNQEFQLHDGAAANKLAVIPNGIDLAKYQGILPDGDHPPTVAFIGRVVPIKDVKTFIRAIGVLRGLIPAVQALIMGPTDEDPEYFEECVEMVRHLGLGDSVTFTGRVNPMDYMPRVDVMVLTSISEAQPLTILEAGAAGIPSVATDVGACREMILGRSDESPALGPGGAVTPLCSPASTAAALATLLKDPGYRRACGEAIRQRVQRYYDKAMLDRTYRDLYDVYRSMPDVATNVDMAEAV